MFAFTASGISSRAAGPVLGDGRGILSSGTEVEAGSFTIGRLANGPLKAGLDASKLRLLSPGRLALCNRRSSRLCEARKPLEGWH